MSLMTVLEIVFSVAVIAIAGKIIFRIVCFIYAAVVRWKAWRACRMREKYGSEELYSEQYSQTTGERHE